MLSYGEDNVYYCHSINWLYLKYIFNISEVMLGYDEGNITPTVELNALAMKRGEPAIYRPIEPQRPQYYPPPNFDFRGMYNQRYF